MSELKLVNKKTLIWGHRGARALAPENTLLAMRRGYEAGADGWEIDVQTTRDKELIVLHDLNLLRTTNAGVHPSFAGHGLPLPWLFTLKELKKLFAGIFPRRLCPLKSPDKTWLEVPENVATEVCIPTLDEILKLADELGLWVNIEIKDLSGPVPADLKDDIVERVLSCVGKNLMQDRVILSSFNHSYMKRSKEIAPEILTGLLTEHKFSGDPVMALAKNKADAWHPGFRFLTRDIVRAVRDCGFAINPYTVNEPEDMRRLIKWGVTGLVTDSPAVAAGVMSE